MHSCTRRVALVVVAIVGALVGALVGAGAEKQ